MSDVQTDLFDHGDCEYDLDFILNNPIPALCTKGRTPLCGNKVENIRAPELGNVRCFWCGGDMKAADERAYQHRLANLWRHVSEDS